MIAVVAAAMAATTAVGYLEEELSQSIIRTDTETASDPQGSKKWTRFDG